MGQSQKASQRKWCPRASRMPSFPFHQLTSCLPHKILFSSYTSLCLSCLTTELCFSKDAFALVTMRQLVLDNFITLFIHSTSTCLLAHWWSFQNAPSISEEQQPHPACSQLREGSLSTKDWNAALGGPNAATSTVQVRGQSQGAVQILELRPQSCPMSSIYNQRLEIGSGSTKSQRLIRIDQRKSYIKNCALK